VTPVDKTVLEALAQVIDKPCKITVYAENQSQYLPLPALVFEDGKILTEWTLTEAERVRIAAGENIRLWIWTYNRPLQPVALQISGDER